MRFLINNHIQNAYQSLRSTKMRTTLTMLGVTIGVASITAILALSGGAIKTIDDQVRDLDGNVTIIRPGVPLTQTDNFSIPTTYQGYATSTLTEDDLEAIQALDGTEAAAPLMIINSSLRTQSSNVDQVPVVATTPEFAEISQLEIRDGQFMDSVTNPNTAVIGTQLSVNLFGTEQSIGQTFNLRGQNLTVIGVLERQNDPINFNNIDFDSAAMISLENGKLFNQGVAQLQQINVKATSADQIESLNQEIEKTLFAAHEQQKDFTILSGDDLAKPSSQLFQTIAGVSAAIAAISLLVGGIGIMNIMLVNVAERTREIGIRKALGATNMDIVWQFLIESLAIGIVGGIAGYFVGYLAAFAISTTLTFAPTFSWEIGAVALGISLGVGVVFGLYPALRAARKDPIEALRHFN